MKITILIFLFFFAHLANAGCGNCSGRSLLNRGKCCPDREEDKLDDEPEMDIYKYEELLMSTVISK